MKKLFILLVGCCLMSCNSGQDQGVDNACQFAKEQIGVSSEDIESMEVMAVDSLLTDIGLLSGFVQTHKAAVEFLEDRMTKTEYEAVLDSLADEFDNVSNSWMYGSVVTDSLRQLDKLSDQWRRVYTVNIKMKSGNNETLRVMMDNDGVTPQRTENQMASDLNKLGREFEGLTQYLKD